MVLLLGYSLYRVVVGEKEHRASSPQGIMTVIKDMLLV
jgi:hypothetical protein